MSDGVFFVEVMDGDIGTLCGYCYLCRNRKNTTFYLDIYHTLFFAPWLYSLTSYFKWPCTNKNVSCIKKASCTFYGFWIFTNKNV